MTFVTIKMTQFYCSVVDVHQDPPHLGVVFGQAPDLCMDKVRELIMSNQYRFTDEQCAAALDAFNSGGLDHDVGGNGSLYLYFGKFEYSANAKIGPNKQ